MKKEKVCPRCEGRGYKKLPEGYYGMIKCSLCGGNGKDPFPLSRAKGKI